MGCSMHIWETFGIGSAGAFVGTAVFFCFRSFLSSYLSEKGKGLATKEDIGAITTIVESIKHDNSEALAHLQEQLKAASTLRFLAAERRLEVHQKAYRYWIEMFAALHKRTEEKAEKYGEIVNFWNDNCLYLEAEVRAALAAAMGAYLSHRELTEDSHLQDRQIHAAAIRESYDAVAKLGAVITEACNLPPLANEAKVAGAINQ